MTSDNNGQVMAYKRSRYNIFVPYGENTILFNPFSGAIGVINPETLERLKTDRCSPEEIELLLKKGVYIPEDFDEWEKMAKDRAEGIRDASSKYVRIWTTSMCNAKCFYCYEKGIKPIPMTKETADAAVLFIKGMLTRNDTLYVEWFGGEPLLNQNIITYIMDQLAPYAATMNIRIESKIITNGSLITDETADLMAGKWNTKMVQVTLDGMQSTYNHVKNYADPIRNNFDSVISNIHRLTKRDIRVAIRMNYDGENYESLSALIDYISEEFSGEKHVYCYVYPLWDCLNRDDNERFRSNVSADDNYILLIRQLVKKGMGDIKDLARLNYRKNQCRSCNEAGYSIFPDGTIGKCSETYIQRIGDIWRGVTDYETEEVWISTDVDEDCRHCKLMPLCQGGCRSSKFTDMPRCYVNKPVLLKLLKLYVETLQASGTPKEMPKQ